MNEYQLKNKNNKLEVVKKLNSFDTGFKFELKKDDDGNHFTIIAVGKYKITVRTKEYAKYYSFFLQNRYEYVNYSTENEVIGQLKEPQNVGVLNAKKIKEWCNFSIKKDQELKKISDQRKKEVTQFLQAVKKIKGQRQIWDNQKSGKITQNGIVFSYTIENNGYINKKIKISCEVDKNLKSFEQLANNKLA